MPTLLSSDQQTVESAITYLDGSVNRHGLRGWGEAESPEMRAARSLLAILADRGRTDAVLKYVSQSYPYPVQAAAVQVLIDRGLVVMLLEARLRNQHYGCPWPVIIGLTKYLRKNENSAGEIRAQCPWLAEDVQRLGERTLCSTNNGDPDKLIKFIAAIGLPVVLQPWACSESEAMGLTRDSNGLITRGTVKQTTAA